MTKDEFQKKQEETLNALRQYNKDRETQIIEEPVSETLEIEEKFIKPRICHFCNTVAYPGQIHGLGFCKEKVQYEQ